MYFPPYSWRISSHVIFSLADVRSLGSNFDGIITQTTKAHRLLLKAWRVGGQEKQLPLLHALFEGYFERAQNMGDDSVLADAASETGVMTREEACRAFIHFNCHADGFGISRR